MEFESKPNELIWNNLDLISTKERKKLLEHISGSVGPSSMTALIGPSGAGKTTLLNALAGRLPQNLKLTGEILYNSKTRNHKEWPKLMGYVEQEFNGYEYQTVYETLFFTSNVKNGYGGQNIDDIMNILGLTNVRNNYLINLSGGERKRLSIGVELLGNPPIIFLDEPTSGLDSFNAINILELLKKLTTLGKTILVTIHQPSYKMISYFDKMILLSQGGMIYEGNVDGCIDFFSQSGYPLPPKTNPTDFFLDTISLDTRTKPLMDKSVRKINELENAWKKREIKHTPTCEENVKPTRSNLKNIIFTSLLSRNLSNYYRQTNYLIIKIFQKVIFILIFGLAYLRMGYTESEIFSRKGSITFLVLNNLFGICGPIFNVFPQEKKVIVRERRSGMYSGYTAFLAKFVSEIPINLLYDISYVIVLYWVIGLNPRADRFFITLIIIASLILFSVAFGLTISTLSPTQNIAQIIGSTFILLFTVYSGAFNETNTIPAWLRWLIYLSPAYYSYTALLQVQFNDLEFTTSNGIILGQDIIYGSGSNILGTWWCIELIWLYTLAWILLGSVALQYVTRSNTKLENQEKETV